MAVWAVSAARTGAALARSLPPLCAGVAIAPDLSLSWPSRRRPPFSSTPQALGSLLAGTAALVAGSANAIDLFDDRKAREVRKSEERAD